MKRDRADPGRQSRLFCLFGLSDCRHYGSCVVYSVPRIGYQLIGHTLLYVCTIRTSKCRRSSWWLADSLGVFCDVQYNFV